MFGVRRLGSEERGEGETYIHPHVRTWIRSTAADIVKCIPGQRTTSSWYRSGPLLPTVWRTASMSAMLVAGVSSVEVEAGLVQVAWLCSLISRKIPHMPAGGSPGEVSWCRKRVELEPLELRGFLVLCKRRTRCQLRGHEKMKEKGRVWLCVFRGNLSWALGLTLTNHGT